MTSPPPSRILLCADVAAAEGDLRQPLEQIGHPAIAHTHGIDELDGAAGRRCASLAAAAGAMACRERLGDLR